MRCRKDVDEVSTKLLGDKSSETGDNSQKRETLLRNGRGNSDEAQKQVTQLRQSQGHTVSARITLPPSQLGVKPAWRSAVSRGGGGGGGVGCPRGRAPFLRC